MKHLKLLFAMMALISPFAANAQFQTVFDGGIPAGDQGWHVIGGDYQTIVPAPFTRELLIDTRSDGSLISGVYGPIPGVNPASPNFDLDIAFLQYSEFNTPPDGTSLSIIITGNDPAKSLQLGVGFGRVWYYDEMLQPSAPLLDLGPDRQFFGAFYVDWRENFAIISGDALWPLEHTVPLFDYRTAAPTRNPAVAPIYSLPNTLFIGDESGTEPTFVWLGRSVVEHQAAVVPVPPAILSILVPCFVLRRCRSQRLPA